MTDQGNNKGKKSGKRNNGSKRKRAQRRVNRQRWASFGIKVGSINIAGASYFKYYLLQCTHEFDILCLQETWLLGQPAGEIDIPGFRVLEQRRQKGRRGGIAIIVRNSLPILAYQGNEYAQFVHVGLPDGEKAVIKNVYLPPYESLRRRKIQEVDAKTAVQGILTATPAAKFVITCGDFNTRIADRAPTIADVTLKRRSLDPTVNNRATWMLQMCELTESHILNGNEH